MIFGYYLNESLEAAGLPLFVSCLIGNTRNILFKKDEAYPGARLGIALISDISLGMFLTMALMGAEALGTARTVAVHQRGDAVPDPAVDPVHPFHRLPHHGQRLRGERDQFRLRRHHAGLMATAIINMTAVAKQYGAAHRAFIVVPLVCGFSINFFVSL